MADAGEDPSKGPPEAAAGALKIQHKGPLRKLTVDLLKTYKGINEKYYKRKREMQKDPKKERDKKHDFQAHRGKHLNAGRYQIIEQLGKGSFGQVVSCHDTKKGGTVAIKVIKSKEAFRRQARTEVALLKMLNRKDPTNQWCIVRLLEEFEHTENEETHTCLVFEHLSFNLYELLKKTMFKGVSLNLVRKFARQILKTLAYLSLPDVNVIHCDLKPENILLRSPSRSAIKVIDFGSSCRANYQMYVYIQSRFYRSPEVILGLPYNHAIDVWSLGCILVEMHTGQALFCGRDEADQMRRFVTLKGLPPRSMLDLGRKTSRFFDKETVDMTVDSDTEDSASDEEPMSHSDNDESDSTEASTTRKKQRVVYKVKEPAKGAVVSRRRPATSLREVIGVHTGGPGGRRAHERTGHSQRHYIQFLDLVERMLDYNPETRIKPMQALNHPFLREDMPPVVGARAPSTAAAATATEGASTATGVGGGGTGGSTRSAPEDVARSSNTAAPPPIAPSAKGRPGPFTDASAEASMASAPAAIGPSTAVAPDAGTSPMDGVASSAATANMGGEGPSSSGPGPVSGGVGARTVTSGHSTGGGGGGGGSSAGASYTKPAPMELGGEGAKATGPMSLSFAAHASPATGPGPTTAMAPGVAAPTGSAVMNPTGAPTASAASMGTVHLAPGYSLVRTTRGPGMAPAQPFLIPQQQHIESAPPVRMYYTAAPVHTSAPVTTAPMSAAPMGPATATAAPLIGQVVPIPGAASNVLPGQVLYGRDGAPVGYYFPPADPAVAASMKPPVTYPPMVRTRSEPMAPIPGGVKYDVYGIPAPPTTGGLAGAVIPEGAATTTTAPAATAVPPAPGTMPLAAYVRMDGVIGPDGKPTRSSSAMPWLSTTEGRERVDLTIAAPDGHVFTVQSVATYPPPSTAPAPAPVSAPTSPPDAGTGARA